MEKKLIKNKSTFGILFVLTMIGVLFVGLGNVVHVAKAEWNEPVSGPPSPTETYNAPLTTGPENQAKAGNLMLWPDYGLTSATSLTFLPEKPLDIRGAGATFSTPYVYNDILAVDNTTLYANSIQGWVGIGTKFQTAGTALKVEGGPVQVGSETAPIDGRAVSGVSSSGAGLTAVTDNSVEGVGVYGANTGNSAPAIKGTSTYANAIKGVSNLGTGIQAYNQDLANAAVYGQNAGSGLAGYFKGFFGAGADVVARQFLARGLNNSIIPFTSGQELATYSSFGTWTNTSSTARTVFDGTYIWTVTKRNSLADNKSLFKYRASDGALVQSYVINDTTSGVSAIGHDGKYIWIINYSSDAVRFNPADGSATTVDLLPSANYSSITFSSEAGQTYAWVTVDDGSGVYDGVYKINTTTLAVTLYAFHSSANGAVNLGLTGVDDVYSNAAVFDGQYIWMIATSGYLVRLWAESPNNATHPPVDYSTLFSGAYRSLTYDGQYLWLGCKDTALPILRVWAADPNDPGHPMNYVYPPGGVPAPGYLKAMVFDGTYVWAMNHDNPTLYRYSAADPQQRTTIITSVATGTDNMVFDGTNIWISQAGTPPTLHKIFSGTGYGQTDLSRVVSLDPAAAQPGYVNVSGAGVVGTNLTVGTDVQAPGNLWGGTDETVGVSGNAASCATNGKFMTGIVLDSNSVPTSIICNGL
jgi:hypothetical protein